MLSMIEVRCPHCAVRGQILLPPLGAIIVGPCPNCEEMVVVFCGRALALDKEIMLHGTDTEKHEHLKGVLIDFLDSRIDTVVEQLSPETADGLRDYSPEALVDESEGSSPTESEPTKPALITDSEVEQFLRSDLPRLDNRDYFKTIFD